MKTSYKVTVLAILLAIFASSCTKEITSPNTIANGTSYSATYTVNGHAYLANPQTNVEWASLVDSLLALAKEGYSISIWPNSNSGNTLSAKEVLTLNTPDKELAQQWCLEKISQGYTTTIVFDETTGEYHCEAKK